METCRRLGIQTVAVYSEADAEAKHTRMADEAVSALGPLAFPLTVRLVLLSCSDRPTFVWGEGVPNDPRCCCLGSCLSLHCAHHSTQVCIGPAPSSESYLVMDEVLAAIKSTGADAVHPGYGFLSENAEFSAAVQAAGAVFLGPDAHAINQMGDKIMSMRVAQQAGVSTAKRYDGVVRKTPSGTRF